MKTRWFLIGLALLAAISLSFYAGARFASHLFIEPLNERMTGLEIDMFERQTFAITQLQKGSSQQPIEYLRTRNIYSIWLISIQDELLKKIPRRPALIEAIQFACDDIEKNTGEYVWANQKKSDTRKSCAKLLSSINQPFHQ